MHTGVSTRRRLSTTSGATGIDPEGGRWQTNSGSIDGIGPFDTASVVADLATDL